MAVDPNSFMAKYGVRTLSYAIGLGLAVLLVLLAFASCAHTVENTDVGIVVNNITGHITLYENGGMVLHLPFGLSSFYKITKQPHHMRLAREVRTSEHQDGDQVRIKTVDGSNVEVDIEVVYQIDVKNAYIAFRELVENTDSDNHGSLSHDAANNMESIIRAVTRADVRNRLGDLTTLAMSDPDKRNMQLDLVLRNLKDYFGPMGVDIVSINAQNFQFNEAYEALIRQRKASDQILVNQEEFRAAKEETKKRMIAEAEKDSQTAIAQLQGELRKTLLAAEGEGKRIMTKAQQMSYQLDREGEIARTNAEAEAGAIRAEGEQKALAIEKLFEAYEKGGEGMVREALSKLYEGVIVNARPYSQSDRIDQYQTTPAVPPTVETAPASIRPARSGGSNGH